MAPFDLQSHCVCVSFTGPYEHNLYGKLKLQILPAWLRCVLAATQLPQLITDIQDDACDLTGCAAACFRGVPEAALCKAAQRRSSSAESQIEKRKSRICLNFKIKHPVQTHDHIKHTKEKCRHRISLKFCHHIALRIQTLNLFPKSTYGSDAEGAVIIYVC